MASSVGRSILQSTTLGCLLFVGAVGAAHLHGDLATRSSAQLPLSLTAEGWYVASVSLGGVPVRLAIDTGSETLWVRSALVAGRNSTAKAASFLATSQRFRVQYGSPMASNRKDRVSRSKRFRGNVALRAASFLAQAPHFRAQYGRGAVEGDVRAESVRLQQESAHTCSVGIASTEGPFWSKQRTIDGLLGLACSEDLPAGAASCVLPQAPRMFALQLLPEGGTLSFGSIPLEYMSSLKLMPPSSRCGHWTVPLLAMSVGDSAQDPRQDRSAPSVEAIIDSGTNGIVGPTFDVIALARLLGGTPAPAGDAFGGLVTFYTVPCTAAASLPTVTLSLGARGREANVTLDGDALVKMESDDRKDCFLHIAGWETDSWILGVAFLKQLRAAVFNLDDQQVGFAL